MNSFFIQKMIIGCGIGHFFLCMGSLFIPRALQWNMHLRKLDRLLRQIFWTYAGYILMINLGFGAISAFGSDELVDGSFLAKSITLFIGTYWLTRIVIQFFYFDRSEAPKGLRYIIGEISLVSLFVVFSLTYLAAFFFNCVGS